MRFADGFGEIDLIDIALLKRLERKSIYAISRGPFHSVPRSVEYPLVPSVPIEIHVLGRIVVSHEFQSIGVMQRIDVGRRERTSCYQDAKNYGDDMYTRAVLHLRHANCRQ
jgi:hypothetical protein